MENTKKEFWQLGREDFLRSLYKSKNPITGEEINPQLLCKNENDLQNWINIIGKLLPEVEIPVNHLKLPYLIVFNTDTCGTSTGSFYNGSYKETCLYAPKYQGTSYPYQYIRSIGITKPFTELPDKMLLDENLEEDKVEQYKQQLINN